MSRVYVKKLYIALVIIIVVVVLAIVLYLISTPTKPSEVVARPGLPLLDIVKGSKASIILSSDVFSNFSTIPRKYTCDGEDISPPLRISNVPKDTRTLTLIVYDPDAPKGIFYHWIVYNIPPTTNVIGEGIGKKNVAKIAIGLQGRNDFGYIGYGGPCPPPSHKAHRYVFLIIALDKELDILAGASIDQVINSCRGHVIAYGLLVGLYQR